MPFLGTPDLSEFDHIEVLRGADGLFGSNGNPGATVSLVRKRALHAPELTFDTLAGSWDNYRVEVDATGPLALDGALRGRLDGVYSDRNYFYETAELRRRKIFGALEYDLTPVSALIVGGSYQWDDAIPFAGGLPLNQDGSDPHLPRDTALTFDWARYSTRTRELYLQFHRELASDWRLRVNTTAWRGAVEYATGFFQSQIDPVTHGLFSAPSATVTTRPNTQNQFAVDVTLTGAFDWFDHREELAIGGDYTRFESSQGVKLYSRFSPVVSNIS